MACGSCGGKGGGSKANQYVVTVAGSVQAVGGSKNDGRFETTAEARIWIARNVTGVAATIKAVPRAKA